MSDDLPPEPVSSVLEKADERENVLLNFAIAARTLVFWSPTLYVLHITYKILSAAKWNRIKAVHKKLLFQKRDTILYNL